MHNSHPGGARLPARAALILFCIVLQAAAARAQDNVLSIDPATSTPVDSVFSLAVVRNAGDEVSGFEVVIAFDPAIAVLEAVEPGAWVTEAGLPFFFYDATHDGTDEIAFSVALLGQETSALGGEVARCRFRIKHIGVSPLTFVSLQARDANNEPVLFGHSTGDQIIVQEAVGAGTFSLGRVKALYR